MRTRLKTNQLMLCREIIAVCSQIHTEHINTLCGLNVEFFNVKPNGRSIYNNQEALQGQMKNTFDFIVLQPDGLKTRSIQKMGGHRDVITWGCVSGNEIISVCLRYDASIRSPAMYKELIPANDSARGGPTAQLEKTLRLALKWRRPTNNLPPTVSSHSSCVSTGHQELL